MRTKLAGELDGRFQIFNVWEAREHSDRFTRERIRPALVAVMGEERVASLPEPEMVEVTIHKLLDSVAPPPGPRLPPRSPRTPPDETITSRS